MYLRDQGYEVTISEWEPISEYGTGHKWRRFTNKINDVSASAWGNMIAFRPQPPFDSFSSDGLTKLKEQVFS